MMGINHAASGAGVGLGVAYALGAFGLAGASGAVPVPLALLCAALCAGAALLPDLDSPTATAAHTFGPLSRWAAKGVSAFSAAVYQATATELDDDRDGGHRGVTHTWPFAAVVGALCALAALSRWGLLAVLFVMLSLALRGLVGKQVRRNGWVATSAVAAALTMAAAGVLDGDAGDVPLGQAPLWVGASVALGCMAHCWGDSCTDSGCPWLWPFKINGMRWYPLGLWTPMRFKTGKTVEKRLVRPIILTGTVAALIAVTPGWPAVVDTVSGFVPSSASADR